MAYDSETFGSEGVSGSSRTSPATWGPNSPTLTESPAPSGPVRPGFLTRLRHRLFGLSDAEAFEAAADLISDPARWAVGKTARDAYGFPVSPTSARATQWCMAGAIVKAKSRGFRANYDGLDLAHPSVTRAGKLLGVGHIFEINDLRGHEAAVTALRQAAALARKAGA